VSELLFFQGKSWSFTELKDKYNRNNVPVIKRSLSRSTQQLSNPPPLSLLLRYY
jgi:hypothetical protein